MESIDPISSFLSDTRKLNIIVHGLQEDNAGKDKTIIGDLFDTVGLKFKPKVTIDKSGAANQTRKRKQDQLD